MDRFIDFINAALPDAPGNEILYAFKRQVLDEMRQRYTEVSTRGVDAPRVLQDLVMSEHPDLAKEYAAYRADVLKKRKAKRNTVRNVVGSVVYLLLLVGVYLFVSFATAAWHVTWAIIPCGVLAWVTYLLSLGVRFFTSLPKIFHVLARVCLAGAVIVATVAVYLFVIAVSDLPHSWLIIIFGLILMFAADGIFAVVAKHRLAILSWLLYVPVIATFLFIIVGALSLLPWGVAWIMIPLSLILDVAIVVSAAGRHKLEKTEVMDAWNEN